MNILAHRGYWKHAGEKNTVRALERAFENGWGIETDVRDYRGELIISHDIGTESCPLFERVLEAYRRIGSKAFLAVNIKADGIQGLVCGAIRKYGVTNYAVFDMSVPEQVVYRRERIPYFTRQSEIEEIPVLYEDAAGVWMDGLERDWICREAVSVHLKRGKRVGIISPEIHGRANLNLWADLRGLDSGGVYLCTDMPAEAEGYFHG